VTLRVLALLCLVSGCGERALDGSLSGADLGRVDLASIPNEGIPCGEALCSAGVLCCLDEDTRVQVCGGPRCFGPYRWLCDGPEDCAADRVCIGTSQANGTPSSTVCVPARFVGDATVVCHGDPDCVAGGACVPNEATIGGAPPFSSCRNSPR